MTLLAVLAPARQAPAPAVVSQVAIGLKIIQAGKGGGGIDERLKTISAQFKDLAFTSYRLLDEATFRLDLNTSGTMEFPGKRWLKVTPREVDAAKVVKVDLAVEQIKFTATARIPSGGMLTIGGPPHDGGTLLLVLTATYPAPPPAPPG